jgi:cyclopropane fatty-acyl-phospholipid synthase-like methyltransferase
MASNRDDGLSLTHTSSDKLTKHEVANEIEFIKSRLSRQFSSDNEKRDELLKILDVLSEFELGRFLIKNKGALSGYWTWYIILGFHQHIVASPLERFILEKVPTILATQERFQIFQMLLAKHIQSNSTVCSIPCGTMADLLTLKLGDAVTEVRFVGIDLDTAAFELAKDLAKQMKSRSHCEFFKKDAWNLEIKNEFDVITTNGLNIYEKEDSRVVALYRGLFDALKSNGKLICSALTYPPIPDVESEWELSKIDSHDLQTASTLFKIILEATWANFRTSQKTCSQLQEAGFEDVEIHWDSRKIFPTFSARKPSKSFS